MALQGDASMGGMLAGNAREREQRLEALAAEIAQLQKSREEIMARFDKERAALDKVLVLRGKVEGSPASEGKNGDKVEAVKPDPTALPALDQAIRDFAATQGEEPLVALDVDARLVAAVVASWTGIPAGKMMKDEAAAILTFKQRLAERIKGQDQALDAVDRGMRAARSGLKNPQAPIGQFLFVGPSGVGKTETAIGVAELLFGGERFLTTINMSEFKEKHTVSRLVGSPPGYVGYGEGGMLTEAIRQRPYSVVLLDECEKADPEILEIFYQVFDKGMLQDGEGREIDCKNCVFFLTSNLCTDIIQNLCAGPVRPTREELVAAIRPALSKWFKPALLARMEVVPFFTLPTEHLRDIVKLKLKKIGNRLMDSHKMKAEFAPEMIDVIANRCTEVETGARNIDHIISETLLPMMSNALLEKMSEGAVPDTMKVTVGEGDRFEISFEDRGTRDAAPAAAATVA